MTHTTLRIVDSLRHVYGEWFVAPEDTKKQDYVFKKLRDIRFEDPRSGWKLQTRGEFTDWHDYEAAVRP
jgi:hypothetical protein